MADSSGFNPLQGHGLSGSKEEQNLLLEPTGVLPDKGQHKG